jgi:predicted dehydrogenase
MRFLLNEEIVKVGGMIKTLHKTNPSGKLIPLDDNAFVVMESASGVIGTMNISWTHYGGYEDNGTVLYCENGTLRVAMDSTYGVMVDYANGQKERHVVGEVATNEKQVASGVIDTFTQGIQTRTKPTIDGLEGYRAMNIIVTAMEAAKEGKFKRVSLA